MSDRMLLWLLFEMVKEVMPPTEANARRFTEWAVRFHGQDIDVKLPEPIVEASNPMPELDDIMDDEVAEDPHEHGVPHRSRPVRKKR